VVPVLIHNEHDAASRALLAALAGRFPNLQVYDFLWVCPLVPFRGCPAVWLFADGQDPFTHRPAWKGEVDVTLEAVLDAIPRCRVLTLAADKTRILADGTDVVRVTVSMTDLDLRPVPVEPVTWEAAGRVFPDDPTGVLELTTLTPGVYEILCRHPHAAEARIEVIATAPD
jgi:hypothetical protein